MGLGLQGAHAHGMGQGKGLRTFPGYFHCQPSWKEREEWDELPLLCPGVFMGQQEVKSPSLPQSKILPASLLDTDPCHRGIL